MNNTDLESYILKLLKANRKGVSVEVILDYLDYTNKVRYSEGNILEILNEFIKKDKVLRMKSLFILK